MRRTVGCTRLPHLTPVSAARDHHGDRTRSIAGGQLKLSMYVSGQHLTVHVKEARYLHFDHALPLNTAVQVSLIPAAAGRNCICRTDVACNSDQPIYDEKFSFELAVSDLRRRVLVTLWQTSDHDPRLDRLVGATSFGVLNVACNKTVVEGWYWILHDVLVGKTKHQTATPRRANRQTLCDMMPCTVMLRRQDADAKSVGRNGAYGLTLTGGRPCTVGAVKPGGMAVVAGLRPGDVICRVNGHCVITASTDNVARILRHCAKGVVMEIRRPVAPPTVDNRGTPRLYAVSDDVMYSSSDDDDADDSSLNLSSLNDDVDFD